MYKLSSEQIVFLKSQGISPTQVFDASATSKKSEREAQMTALELYFYYGGAVCQKGGHSLRTKAGHCIQCDRSKIAYQLRSSSAGYVYVAFSQSKKLSKIGFTKNHPNERVGLLSKERYANTHDWALKKYKKYESDAGKKEFEIHLILEKHLATISYEKNRGEMVTCRETFSCELSIALKAFDAVTLK